MKMSGTVELTAHAMNTSVRFFKQTNGKLTEIKTVLPKNLLPTSLELRDKSLKLRH